MTPRTGPPTPGSSRRKAKVRAAEVRLKLRDGSPVWVAITGRKITGENGQTLYYQGFFEDINERKRLEAEAVAHVRELRILSEMNSALLRARAENELLKDYAASSSKSPVIAWPGWDLRNASRKSG